MMPGTLRLFAMMVVLLYALCMMLLLGMGKIGNLMGAISRTKYEPDSTRHIQAWSTRMKLIHVAILAAACVVAFWPR